MAGVIKRLMVAFSALIDLCSVLVPSDELFQMFGKMGSLEQAEEPTQRVSTD